MGDAGGVRPFEAYRGDEPYLFASYAHRDVGSVFPELRRLHSLGYRIWYDEGIAAANEWPDEIARALDGCVQVVVFLSLRAISSRNVLNEIHYALDKGKPVLVIEVDHTRWPDSVADRLSRQPLLQPWRTTAEDYHRAAAEHLDRRARGRSPAELDGAAAAAGPGPSADAGAASGWIYGCYAAGDASAARAELTRLRRLGFRVRDGGAAEHTGAVASGLTEPSLLVVFISPHAVRSPAVAAQIELALSHGRRLLAVHLARTNLPAGLKLRLGGIQAVLRWELGDEEYHRKLLEALPAELREANPAEIDDRAAARARLAELSALQGQRPLVRDELLEAARHLRARGDEGRAAQAAQAAARAPVAAPVAPPADLADSAAPSAAYACPHCGAGYDHAFRVRCEVCHGELPLPQPAGRPARPPSRVAVFLRSLLSFLPEGIGAVILVPLAVLLLLLATMVVCGLLERAERGAMP